MGSPVQPDQPDHTIPQRKLDQWRAEEIKHERKTMDEVALTRHGRDDMGVLGDQGQ